MTIEQLQEAIELDAQIKKAKECLEILKERDSSIGSVASSKCVELDGKLKEELAESLSEIIERLERSFSWL